MKRNKLLLLLVLLMTAATGAWAQTNLSQVMAAYTAQNGVTLTGTLGENVKISIADGATVTLDGVTINGWNGQDCRWAGINCEGDATIILKGANTVKGFYEDYPGINVPENKTLTIQGTGSLDASSNGYGAGIGGGYDIACGNIVISGGTITATGGYFAAAIGGGANATCGAITITSGVTKVTATKGTNAPYSIGSGANSSGISVTIGGVEGAIATSPYIYPTYSVTLAEGTKDAGNWSIEPKEGLSEGDQVTIQYTGRLKVKGVKATSEAAAEASVPDGALSGKFSVSDGKQVYFSKGNLRYESSKWSFFDNQYDYYTSYSEDAWDHFGWSTSATDYGKNTSTTRSDYSGDFVDWGATMGTGWRMLTSDEWTYLLKTRSASTVGGTENGRYAKAKVNDVKGVILFPDTYTHPDGVTAPTGVNATGDTGWNGNSYTLADWTKMETAGCVFLPAAGYRNGSSVNNPGSVGDYSSATPSGTEKAYELYFSSGSLNTASEGSRYYGLSVRLVSEVATSDEQEAVLKTPATVTTVPTGAAGDINAGSETALVSGGAATGGTMMYKVTTENTQPTSTEGFSADVPTAKTLAAGTYYVWYYVKADDSHTDSEISATAIAVTIAAAAPAIITVTWNNNDITGSGKSFTKDGVTITCGRNIDFNNKNFRNDGTFTTTLGNFTKIEVTADDVSDFSGTSWSGNGTKKTWTGNASSVSFSGDIYDNGNATIKLVFTIEPTN